MIDGFKLFEIYEAVNLHFKSSSYDYFKYGGTTRFTEKTYLKRKDKYFFEHHSRKLKSDNDAIGYCVANFMSGKKYIREFDIMTYNQWTEKYNKIDYFFYEDLVKYIRAKNNYDGNKLNLLIELLHTDQISKEFVVLFNYIMNGEVFKELDKQDDNFLWNQLKGQLNRYAPFLIFLWNVDKVMLEQLRLCAKRAISTEMKISA